ncbi:hypothetical protein Ancab_011034 [Ancistrocladus abbreviatus]
MRGGRSYKDVVVYSSKEKIEKESMQDPNGTRGQDSNWSKREERVGSQEDGDLPHPLRFGATFMQTEGDGPASNWAPMRKGKGNSASLEASPG